MRADLLSVEENTRVKCCLVVILKRLGRHTAFELSAEGSGNWREAAAWRQKPLFKARGYIYIYSVLAICENEQEAHLFKKKKEQEAHHAYECMTKSKAARKRLDLQAVRKANIIPPQLTRKGRHPKISTIIWSTRVASLIKTWEQKWWSRSELEGIFCNALMCNCTGNVARSRPLMGLGLDSAIGRSFSLFESVSPCSHSQNTLSTFTRYLLQSLVPLPTNSKPCIRELKRSMIYGELVSLKVMVSRHLILMSN